MVNIKPRLNQKVRSRGRAQNHSPGLTATLLFALVAIHRTPIVGPKPFVERKNRAADTDMKLFSSIMSTLGLKQSSCAGMNNDEYTPTDWSDKAAWNDYLNAELRPGCIPSHAFL